MKYEAHKSLNAADGRTPRGVRGLKCEYGWSMDLSTGVAPLAGCVD